MNTYEWVKQTQEALAIQGITEEVIIKHCGSIENFCNAVIKTLESHPEYEKVFIKEKNKIKRRI